MLAYKNKSLGAFKPPPGRHAHPAGHWISLFHRKSQLLTQWLQLGLRQLKHRELTGWPEPSLFCLFCTPTACSTRTVQVLLEHLALHSWCRQIFLQHTPLQVILEVCTATPMTFRSNHHFLIFVLYRWDSLCISIWCDRRRPRIYYIL